MGISKYDREVGRSHERLRERERERERERWREINKHKLSTRLLSRGKPLSRVPESLTIANDRSRGSAPRVSPGRVTPWGWGRKLSPFADDGSLLAVIVDVGNPARIRRRLSAATRAERCGRRTGCTTRCAALGCRSINI